MVFKIRDKSLFWTKSGWKNNYDPKILNMPKPINSPNTQYIACKYDHHSFLRMYQSYRNYSRTIRQFTYGDPLIEQLIILELRDQFRIPYTCETPVELIKYGAERRMADQLDRDYELISHNYHPLQLSLYNIHNKYIRKHNQQVEANEKGEKTFQQVLAEEVKKEVSAEESKLPAGEKASLDKITEIYFRVARAARTFNNKDRTEDGEFNDFLEKRRPFLNPNPSGVSH